MISLYEYWANLKIWRRRLKASAVNARSRFFWMWIYMPAEAALFVPLLLIYKIILLADRQ